MLPNIPKEKVLDVVKQGPTIPSRIVKIVGGDTLLIGAILSTLISTGDVKYSTLKIGGSPIYYIPEHEIQLESFKEHLAPKDQKTVNLLKQEKVVKDTAQDPLSRVSLKTVKDFARPFEVNKELFYRYFLVPKDEAERIALDIQGSERKPKDVISDESSSALDKDAALHRVINAKDTDVAKDVSAPSTSPIADVQKIEEDIVLNEPVVAPIPQVVVPVQMPSAQSKENNREVSSAKPSSKPTTMSTGLLGKVMEFAASKHLDIISKEKIKKTEYSFVLKNHDSNEYIYVVAKEKKSISEGDLSTAYVYAQQKKMPCIFLMTGHLTKKAQAMSQKEFKEMQIHAI